LDINLQTRKIEISTFVGIALALTIVYVAISIDGRLRAFFNLASFLIVVGSTFAITAASFSFSDVVKSNFYIIKILFYKIEEPSQAALEAIKMAEYARVNGFNALEKEAKKKGYTKFLLKGIMMIVDGVDIDKIEKIMTQAMHTRAEQRAKVISILRKSAELAPAMGLIGTLIGLVQMLGSLTDVSSIGPAMALALLTTFYGAMLSYMIFFPLASKVEGMARDELVISKLHLKALLSIIRKENPRMLEQVLNSLLTPAQNIYYFK
jgi:chemotaxis protein MotA